MKQAKRILTVEVRRMSDESPDTSWLGEFSNRADTQFAIDHQERTGSNRVKQWFNPGTVEDFDPAASWIPAEVANKRQYWHDAMTKNAEQDYARMCSLMDGEFEFIGIGAEAEVVVEGVCQTIHSGGLWGIESDSDESYLREIEQEQLGELRDQLYALGFSKRAIAAAVKAEVAR
jgi:hypothetical protein